ncbi:MAG: hypothetical protein KC609_04385 [Myxococcales bacterium]|nr:hypothetical protein [Myxococcales bacterium]
MSAHRNLSRITMVALTSFTISAISAAALACKCDTSRTFLSVARYGELVIVGRVERYQQNKAQRIPLYMDVRVERVLKGAHSGRQIRIFGDNGMLCRPYVRRFGIGTRWVFVLRKGHREAGYMISICGEHWLAVKGRWATSTRSKARFEIAKLPALLTKP